jgi:hypothetical protein
MAKVSMREGQRRLVWRVTAAAPLGEYVDPDAPPVVVRHPQVDRTEPGWLLSSFELANGLDSKDVSDSIPGDLFDKLFGQAAEDH